jgi:hypothetical protein
MYLVVYGVYEVQVILATLVWLYGAHAKQFLMFNMFAVIIY